MLTRITVLDGFRVFSVTYIHVTHFGKSQLNVMFLTHCFLCSFCTKFFKAKHREFMYATICPSFSSRVLFLYLLKTLMKHLG